MVRGLSVCPSPASRSDWLRRFSGEFYGRSRACRFSGRLVLHGSCPVEGSPQAVRPIGLAARSRRYPKELSRCPRFRTPMFVWQSHVWQDVRPLSLLRLHRACGAWTLDNLVHSAVPLDFVDGSTEVDRHSHSGSEPHPRPSGVEKSWLVGGRLSRLNGRPPISLPISRRRNALCRQLR